VKIRTTTSWLMEPGADFLGAVMMSCLALVCVYQPVLVFGPAIGLTLVLLIAHRLHPGVRWTWFFMPPRLYFTATVTWAGLFAQLAAVDELGVIAGDFAMAAWLLLNLAITWWHVWLIALVFKGKAMPEVFSAVAPEREGWLVVALRRLSRRVLWFAAGVAVGVLVAFNPSVPARAHPAPIAHSAVSGADECFFAGIPIAVGDSLPNGQRCYISHDPLHPGLLMFTPTTPLKPAADATPPLAATGIHESVNGAGGL